MASKLDQIMRGRVWKFGDSIDTNQLSGVPNAKTMEDIKASCLVGQRPEFPSEAKPGDLMATGTNFGAGSSRQSAVEVLMYMGIQAVLAESVGRIYFRNSMSLAFPVFIAPGITQIVEDGQELEVDYAGGVARNPATGAEVKINKYAPSVERMFRAGGLANLIAERLAEQGITP
jgi:3-isopropylmalate dehydratase small subunit